ncbi:MAG: hypothetical protein WBX09_01260 [Terracidiphilus sp.]
MKLEERRSPFWRRRRALMVSLVTAGLVLAAVGVILAVLARHLEPFLRAQIVAELEVRFHTRVELDQFHVSVREGQEAMWGIWAEGRGLRIWPPQRKGWNPALEAVNSVPLIELNEFSFHVPLKYKETRTLRIPEVRLAGLKIVLPPKTEPYEKTEIEAAMGPRAVNAGNTGVLENVVVEQVVCQGAELELVMADPAKLPLIFEIQTIALTHLVAGKPMDFDAVLTNPKPRGLIRTQGSFGPWIVDDPGASALKGKYRFEKANLGEFKGIAGTLSSTGTYDGTLRDIAVTGAADVPNFSLTKFGTSMELETDFKARVNGTDGDTDLDEVDARLGQSRFRLTGKVVRVRMDANGKEVLASAWTGAEQTGIGHLIDMKVDVPATKVEDFLKLVSKSGTPLMTGEVAAHAVLEIPPGKQPVPHRMKLDGQFKLDNARFTNEKVQQRIEDLSLRGQGKPGAIADTAPASVAATMQGSFQMANGAVDLPDLKYTLPGVKISLNGTYGPDGSLHFDGTARIEATVSQMVGGWKGFLLKPADRFFKKDGAGTLVPITVRGTRDHPDFGLDLGKMGTQAQRPQ